MNISVFARKMGILVITFLVLSVTGFRDLAGAGEDTPLEKWIGKTVNVRISCAYCSTSKPIWLKRVIIKKVTDKGMVVIEMEGFAYYFYRYMVKEIQIAN